MFHPKCQTLPLGHVIRMDFVCSAVQRKQLQGHCSVASMSFGWRCGCPRRPLPLFTRATFFPPLPLCSTTCLSGGYPVTLTCWRYTKHWSLSTCNYVQTARMDSQPGSPLPFVHLFKNNTLSLGIFFSPQVWVTNSKWS